MTDELALYGGTPVRTRPFPAWPIWDEREERALLEVLHSGVWGISERTDTFVIRFEEAFARAHDTRFGCAVHSGSAALEIALRAVGVDYGDEVIVPPYTFMATAVACLLVGALPVFADIDPESYTLDPAAVEQVLTPRTRAVIPVHIGGCPADMEAFTHLAERYHLVVIEDACQAHAAAWDGRRVGAWGALGCFSFQSSKNITAGEGGLITTGDEELAERCRSLRNCGRVRGGAWYEHVLLGDNRRMTEFQAALLLAQLTRLEELAARREANACYLAERLREIGGCIPQKRDHRVTQHAYHLFILRYDADAFAGLPRERFLAALQAEGIPCSGGYLMPLYRLPAIWNGIARLRRWLGYGEESLNVPHCPVAERACAEEAVWFTQNMLLGTTRDMDDIAEAIVKVKRHAVRGLLR